VVRRRIGLSAGDRVFNVLNYAFLRLWLLAIAYPLYFIIIASFSDPFAVKQGRVVLYPVSFTLKAYREVFLYQDVWTGYANSVFYTVVGAAINVFMTVLAAYRLSRKDFWGRNAIMAIFTFTMFFSGGLIPYYLIVRNLGMLNTRWAMIVPGAMSVFFVIMTRTFFQSNIPEELYEASTMDGCSDVRFIASIVLPLSGPVLAVIALYYAVGHWNAFFNALIFLKRDKLFPLQIFLRNILLMNQANLDRLHDLDELVRRQDLIDLLKFALIIVASVPVLLIYPFAQRYFVRGVMIGAIKG